MKLDEFAFVNQQLAAMLKDGIPLEGALRQLCTSMRRGELRTELQKLEADLAKGTPLKEALAARKLPPFYVRMIQVGVASNDLPAVLVMVADYYQKSHSVWTRLKGLMVYPLIVLIASLALSAFLTVLFNRVSLISSEEFGGADVGASPNEITLSLWIPMILLALVTVMFLAMISIPAVRRRLRWRLPAFKEASLSQFAAAMALMLKGGGSLNDAIGLMRHLEAGTPAEKELADWQTRLASGRSKIGEIAYPSKVFPPLFAWLAANAGEDPALGFARAADIYHGRAMHRIEVLLYAALPTSILILGLAICSQLFPLLSAAVRMMKALAW